MTESQDPQRWIWQPDRQVVLERRVEEFARRWQDCVSYFDAGAGSVMLHLLVQDPGSADWFRDERNFIRGIAVGRGLDPDDLAKLARFHNLPEMVFNLSNT